ncbi:MAG: chorismate mutase [Bacteroidales bacterium]|jgi:isochorismate pyruvate lyase|nr:chorismate mutase [Bacteroidales bacterium]
MLKPDECTSLDEVRKQIDEIDEQIMALFGTRFQFVQEVTKYKKPDAESIIAHERRAKVLNRIRQLAEDNHLNPDEFEKMYENLIEHFIQEEIKLVNK